MTDKELLELKKLSAEIRLETLDMFKWRGYGHLGGAMSIVELLSVLYGKQMKYRPQDPCWIDRDYLILSKGHAGPALYSVLAIKGFFDRSWLHTMNDGGTRLPSHVDRLLTPGVDMTCGSLGQGASVGAGIAWTFRHEKKDQRVYVVIGDGELNEGQNWEAFQYLAHNKLYECIIIVDCNKKQLDGYTDEILKPFDLAEKIRAFGFHVQSVDGSDESAISDAIDKAKTIREQAICIVLNTVKGQGVRYYEEMYANHCPKFGEKEAPILDKRIAELKAFIEEGKAL